MTSATSTVPLNCIDKALWAVDGNRGSMVFHWVLRVENRVDPDRLESAIRAVIARHPRMRSVIRTGLLRQVREEGEIPAGGVLTVWDDAAASEGTESGAGGSGGGFEPRLTEWFDRPFPPDDTLPCRALLLRGTAPEVTLVLSFHHCSLDGRRSLAFIREIIAAYGDPAAAGRALPADGAGTNGADELLEVARAQRTKLPRFYRRMAASLFRRFVVTPIARSGRVHQDKRRRSAGIHACQGSLSPDELAQIHSDARSVEASLNDVLLAACFRTVDQWNDARGSHPRKLSIMAPVDIGTEALGELISNQVSFVSPATVRKERSDPEQLLRTVRSRMRRMVGDGQPFFTLQLVHLMGRLPPVLRKWLVGGVLAMRAAGSILLTNLGVVWPADADRTDCVRLGDAGITEMAVVPPSVSPMGMTLCVSTYRRRMHIVLSTSRSQFSASDTAEFLALYLREVRAYGKLLSDWAGTRGGRS